MFRKAVRRAQAEPDAMQADRIVAPQVLQHVPVPARAGKIVFGMDFEPADGRPLVEETPVMRHAQADAGGNQARLPFHGLRPYLPAFGLPPTFSQVPLATYFHSLASLSTLDMPAQPWV